MDHPGFHFGRPVRPGQRIRPFAINLDRRKHRRHLFDIADEAIEDGVDLFSAVFPGGSITGAPKLRAMEIIDELEQRPRGAYCGAVGYVDFDGAMDFNILIRTIDHLPEESVLLAGGGITLMSDPQGELAESELKAERIAPGLFAQESSS